MTCELWWDDRGIEGLPIRLVIALVVGAASLSIMLNMLSGIQGLAITELDVAPEPVVVNTDAQNVTVTVVDPAGDPVADAVVIVEGGTAQLEKIHDEPTNESGVATVSIDPTLAVNQDRGTIEIDVKPPSSGGYVDRRENTEILVIKR